MKHVAAFAVLVSLGLAGPVLAQDSAQQAVGDAGHGHTLFMTRGCYECHGTVGQGGVGLRLAPEPLPATAIAAYLRNPAGEMPPYTSAVVSDKDVDDIHAYLASIPPPPKVADIALLRLGDRR